jgi:3-hydroxyisobutyrate dehydrogenase-like beta-hydroxyacid dehydrogenase
MSEMIGFIGLGNMGAPMAGRLLDGGYALTVHDARESAARPLLSRGAHWAASPAEVAAAAQTVITILPTSRECVRCCWAPRACSTRYGPAASCSR